MTDMKKFDSLFTFLEVYKKMDHDEKVFCQKVLMSFNDSVPTGIVKSELEPFIPVEEQLPQESVHLKKTAKWNWVQSQCDVCWASFVKHNNIQKYCSEICRVRANNIKNTTIEKKCIQCWKLFKTHRNDAKYCSMKCVWVSKKWNNFRADYAKKNEIPPVVKKSDDPYFKPKFIFNQN